jgi:hypothetical protein
MHLELMKGAFTAPELLSLLEPMVQTKIRFNESKINQASTEEDIKMHESRIKQLQQDWQKIRQELDQSPGLLRVRAEVNW